jgi:hypothetical protein
LLSYEGPSGIGKTTTFAGADRDEAKALHDILEQREVACFYDENEQHRIIAANVEDYLAPIYRSEASYVVAFQSPNYPTRIWTKIESDHFRQRFGEGAVIPIRFTTTQPGFFTEDAKYGGLKDDPTKPMLDQIKDIADTLCRRLIDDRQRSSSARDAESRAGGVPLLV